MNLRQCEVFRAVMEVGSVTGAAERLHVTQPAVSKMLAQLERELGFSAFLRERRRLVPTPEAQVLYQEVRRAFIGLDQLQRLAGDLRGMRQGRLVVAASYAPASFHLPGVVAGFLAAHPGLSISMQASNSPRTARAVGEGLADLGVVNFAVATPGVRAEVLCGVDAVCVLPPRHALLRRRRVRATDLHGLAFVALAPVNRLRVRLDALLKAQGIVPRIQVDAPLASTVCSLVMHGAGVAVLDRLSAKANLHLGVVLRPFEPNLTQDLLMLVPEGRPMSLAATAFAVCVAGGVRAGLAERRGAVYTKGVSA